MNKTEFNNVLTKLAGNINFTPVLKWIRQLIIEETTLNFAGEMTPDGERWPRLKRPRSPKKYQRFNILHRKGKLERSVTQRNSEENVDSISNNTLVWGTSDIKAATHQYGSNDRRNIPKREYLGLTEELQDKIADQVGEFVKEEILKRLG